MTPLPNAATRLEIASASRPRLGEVVSGDVTIVRREGGRTLFGIIDGDRDGNGALAEETALQAARFLAQARMQGDLRGLFSGLYDQLRGGLGASATLCLYESGKLWAAGVGNVELRCVGAPLSVNVMPRLLAGRTRQVRLYVGRLAPGARVVLYSDGIARTAVYAIAGSGRAGDVCSTVLAAAALDDDATVMIADVAAA